MLLYRLEASCQLDQTPLPPRNSAAEVELSGEGGAVEKEDPKVSLRSLGPKSQKVTSLDPRKRPFFFTQKNLQVLRSRRGAHTELITNSLPRISAQFGWLGFKAVGALEAFQGSLSRRQGWSSGSSWTAFQDANRWPYCIFDDSSLERKFLK